MQFGMSKVILCTFAGRSDRMKILKKYVDVAIRRKLIDEWHIWDYSRTPEDRAWLQQNFSYIQVTPSHTTERAHLPSTHFFEYGAKPLDVRVRAEGYTSLCLTSVANPGNRVEVTLNFGHDCRSALQVLGDWTPLTYESSHHLSEFALVDLAIKITPSSIEISSDSRVFFDVPNLHLHDDQFLVEYGSGNGNSAEWIFPAYTDTPYRFFIGSDYSRLSDYFPNHFPGAHRFSSFYRFYGERSNTYQEDVFIKCDDDIVYIDLAQLLAYIEQRKKCKQFFLLSANVVNNGVCAYFQGHFGKLPTPFTNMKLHRSGFAGELWESGELANALHNYFLTDPSHFSYAQTVIWNQRISINFISWMGGDAQYFPDLTTDDEPQLSTSIRKRAKKINAIYGPLVVSHLSFDIQSRQKEFRMQDLLERYWKLAEAVCTELC